MFDAGILIALGVLAVVAAGILVVAFGIYLRLERLIREIGDLRALAVGSQGELVKTKEGIGKMHGDISRLVSNSNRTTELVRATTRLPTR